MDSLGVVGNLRPPRAVSLKEEIERTPLAKVNTQVIFGVGSEWVLSLYVLEDVGLLVLR